MTTKIPPDLANVASQAEAEAGVSSTKFMTPQRTAQTVDAKVRVFTSAQLSLPAAGASSTVAHGLGAEPFMKQGQLECISAEIGYSVGDHVDVGQPVNRNNGIPVGLHLIIDNGDTANIRYLVGSSGIELGNKSTGVTAAIDLAKWKLRIKALRIV